MAQHDYVIDNSTGANVRADINNVLQAIATNNSGSSAPSATFASQFFADTSAGIMKLRNTSDNGYVNLFTLGGGINVDAASHFNEDVIFTGASNNIVFDKSENALKFADNAIAKFGGSSDLQIFNNGSTTSFIQETQNNLFLSIAGGSNQLQLNKGTSENMAIFIGDSKCELFFDNSPKFETNATGINMVDNAITFQGQSNRVIKFRPGNNDMIFEADAGLFYRQNIGNSTHEFFVANNKKFEVKATGAHVYGSGSTFLELGSAAGATDSVFIDTSHASNAKPNMDFKLDADLAMRIDTSSRVLIGTTSLTPNPGITLLPEGTIGIGNNAGVSTQSFIEFRRSGTQIGGVTQNGTTGVSFNTSSDYRLKENAVAISDGITRLKTLKPYRFNFIADASTTVDGFFAHEVTAVPEAITGIKDETQDILYTEEDEIPSGKKVGDVKETVPKYQGIDQSKLVPLLVAAVQELIGKVEVLESA